jgi:hypothetical protein
MSLVVPLTVFSRVDGLINFYIHRMMCLLFCQVAIAADDDVFIV